MITTIPAARHEQPTTPMATVQRITHLLSLRDRIDAEIADLTDDYEFTEADMRKAHRLHARGVDNPWVRAGERAYHREAKRRQRREQVARGQAS